MVGGKMKNSAIGGWVNIHASTTKFNKLLVWYRVTSIQYFYAQYVSYSTNIFSTRNTVCSTVYKSPGSKEGAVLCDRLFKESNNGTMYNCLGLV